MSRTRSSQWLKMAMIPVLVAVLLGVLFWPEGKGDLLEGAGDGASAVTATETTPSTSLTATGPGRRSASPLPDSIDLALVGSFNPFAPSRHTASAPAVAGEASEGAKLAAAEGRTEDTEERSGLKPAAPARKVDAIIVRDGSSYVYIDGQLAAEGDVLKDGSTIVAIARESVLVRSD